jgi:hypothetical protein
MKPRVLPKGYRVTTHIASVTADSGFGKTKWYDAMVWKDGTVILSTTMTSFESKDKARESGIRRAWDIFNGAKNWS